MRAIVYIIGINPWSKTKIFSNEIDINNNDGLFYLPDKRVQAGTNQNDNFYIKDYTTCSKSDKSGHLNKN